MNKIVVLLLRNAIYDALEFLRFVIAFKRFDRVKWTSKRAFAKTLQSYERFEVVQKLLFVRNESRNRRRRIHLFIIPSSLKPPATKKTFSYAR